MSVRHLGPYATDVGYTPHLTAFAAEARVFERHQTEAGASGIAYASLFSAGQAPHHGVYSQPRRLDERLTLLGEVFAAAGYETHAWLAHPMANAGLRYDQGVAPERSHPRPLTGDDPDFAALLARLVSDPGARAVAVTNFTVTHRPYPGLLLDAFCERFPEPCVPRRDEARFERYRALLRAHGVALSYDFEATARRLGLATDEWASFGRAIELLYRADVFHLDQRFGAVLDALREAALLDQTLVVFTADHGESLRGADLFPWSHSYSLSAEVLQVPLLIRGPGVEPGRHAGVTRSVDVLPTLAGLAGIPYNAPAGGGVDLSGAVLGREAAPELLAFSHTAMLPQRMLRQLPRFRTLARHFPRADPRLLWVAVREGDAVVTLERRSGDDFTPAAYDLASDPDQTADRFDPGNARHGALAGRLETYRQLLVDAHEARRGGDPGLAEEEQAERLRSLGYIE